MPALGPRQKPKNGDRKETAPLTAGHSVTSEFLESVGCARMLEGSSPKL